MRTGSPIFATEGLLDEAGQSPALEPADEEEAIIDEFRDFLDDLNPEDFRGLDRRVTCARRCGRSCSRPRAVDGRSRGAC